MSNLNPSNGNTLQGVDGLFGVNYPNGSSERRGPPKDFATLATQLATYNVCVSCVISIFLNGTLLVIISSRLGTLSKIYKTVLRFSTVISAIFSCVFAITCPFGTSISSAQMLSGLMIFSNSWFSNSQLNYCLLILSMIFLTELIFLPPITHYFRFCQVVKYFIHSEDIIFVAITNGSLLLLSGGLFCYCSFPSAEENAYFGSITVTFTDRYTPFLLVSYSKTKNSVSDHIATVASIICIATYLFILILSLVVMIYCSFKVNLKVSESRNASTNLTNLQKKMNKLLLSQFLCTLIFVQIPFYYSIIGPVFGVSSGFATDLMPFLFVWFPVINILIIFILNGDIRHALIRKQVDSIGGERTRSNAGL